MTGCQNHGICRYFSFAFHSYARNPAAFQDQIRYPGLKVDFAAMRQDGFPDGFDHARQPVGSDMRMGIDQYILRSAVSYQQGQDFADVPPFMGAGVEFAIRIGAGSAFAKAVIGVRVHNAIAVNLPDILATGYDILSSFQ